MTTDFTELAQRMRTAADKASNGDWVKESGDGWEACCSANDQANGGFIIAHFVGPDAAENREFVQAANPANILALVGALEKAQQRIDELENDEVRQRLANAEHQLYMAELAKHNLKANRKAQFRKRRAAEKRITELESRTVTVKIPYLPDDCDRTEAHYKYQAALRAAGIKVEAE